MTRTVAGFGGLLILEYQKSSAAKACHCAGVCEEREREKPKKI
jgi:hypothetical protein